MYATGFEEVVVEKFRMHDISGAILMDLQLADLKELGIQSFGHRHRLWNEIRALKNEDASQVARRRSDEPIHHSHLDQYRPGQSRPLSTDCPNPSTPVDDAKSPIIGQRRARRARTADDIITPAESASIVAIEQLLPKPHRCSKGENCSKWQKQQRKLAKIAKEFSLELEHIEGAGASPTETSLRPASEAVPSVVASSDLLGPGYLPALRLDEEILRVVQSRDPQENVRQFLDFQHMNLPPEEPRTPPYEMFPPLSPRGKVQPHENLRRLPKLTIPSSPQWHALSPDRAMGLQRATPVTAIQVKDHPRAQDIIRLCSPASEMDVPVMAIPTGPIERDASQSVPPDMRFGDQMLSPSLSRSTKYHQLSPPPSRPQTCAPLQRSTSRVSHRRQPSLAMTPVEENVPSPVADTQAEMIPTVNDVNHSGWMKKRKTKMLRHEWHENHFRLHGTQLAMHRDPTASEVLESIDVDEYAVACSSLASNKLGAAFKSLKLSGKKKDCDATAFSFQLVPAAEKKGMLSPAAGKTHHFAVKTRDERIDWMRELMLAKALKQKTEGCEINLNGSMI